MAVEHLQCRCINWKRGYCCYRPDPTKEPPHVDLYTGSINVVAYRPRDLGRPGSVVLIGQGYDTRAKMTLVPIRQEITGDEAEELAYRILQLAPFSRRPLRKT